MMASAIHIYIHNQRNIYSIKILDYFFICSSSDDESEDLIKQKDNILPKNRKRKRHDTKKKVF